MLQTRKRKVKMVSNVGIFGCSSRKRYSHVADARVALAFVVSVAPVKYSVIGPRNGTTKRAARPPGSCGTAEVAGEIAKVAAVGAPRTHLC